jgi:hypothetical protein
VTELSIFLSKYAVAHRLLRFASKEPTMKTTLILALMTLLAPMVANAGMSIGGVPKRWKLNNGTQVEHTRTDNLTTHRVEWKHRVEGKNGKVSVKEGSRPMRNVRWLLRPIPSAE